MSDTMLLAVLTTALLVIELYYQSHIVTAQNIFDESANTFVFQPLDVLTSTINVNGGTTKQTTAVFQVSNVMNKGSLYIDNFKVDIAGGPPTYNYRMKEVGRIPKAVLSNTVKVCMVADPASYNKAAAANAVTNIQASDPNNVAAIMQADYDAGQGQSTPAGSRRLLQFPDGIVAAVALGIASEALHEVRSLQDTVTGINQRTTTLETQFGALSANLTLFEAQTAANVNYLNTTLRGQLMNFTLDQVGEAKYQLSTMIANVQAFQNNTNKIFAQDIWQLSNETVVLANAIVALAGFLTKYVGDLENDVFTIDGLISDLNAAFASEITQTALKRATTSAYFKLISNLPSAFFPLVTDAGSPPENNGVLAGDNTRILVDEFTFVYDMYLNPTQKTIVLVTVDWYLDAMTQLSQQTSYLTIRNLKGLYTAFNCTRAFYNTGVPWYTPYGTPFHDTGSPCMAWTEFRKQSCSVLNTFNLQYNPGQSAAFSLANIPCISGTTSPIQYTVVTDFGGSMVPYMRDKYCSDGGDVVLGGNYYLYSNLVGMQPAIPQLRNATYINSNFNVVWPCNASAQSQVTTTNTVLGAMLSSLPLTYSAINTKLAVLEQKVFGRLPGGLTYESLPFDYVPPIPNTTAALDPAQAGAYAPRMCHRITFNIAHVQTLPVFSIMPDDLQPVEKTITRRITQIDSSQQLNNASVLQLGQTVSFTENILLADDLQHLLPTSTLIVYDKDAADSSTGLKWIFDVPDRLLDVTNNVYARANTLTYFLMPPGTPSTYSLSEFMDSTFGIYDARNGAVGANLFAVPVTYDPQGFPVCNVGSGLPTLLEMNGYNVNSLRTCKSSSYHWQNNTANVATMASMCDWSRFTYSPTKLYNRNADLAAVNINGVSQDTWMSRDAGFVIHFVYEGSASAKVFDVTVSGFHIVGQVMSPLSLGAFVLTVSPSDGSSFSPMMFQSTFPRLFNLQKHTITTVFTTQSRSSTTLDQVIIFVDSWLDTQGTLSPGVPIAGRTGATSTALSMPVIGVESVYGLPWPASANSPFRLDVIEQLRVCSLAVTENHCALPSEQIVVSAPSNAVTPDKSCVAGAKLLYRSALIDSTTLGQSSTDSFVYFIPSQGFTFTFWLHANLQLYTIGQGNDVVDIAVGNVNSNPLYISCTLTIDPYLQCTLAQGFNTLTITSSPYILPGALDASKIVLLYSASSNSIQMSIDGVIYANAVIPFTLVSPGSGISITGVNQYGGISNVRWYSNTLTPTQIVSDLFCDAYVYGEYAPTVGYCRIPTNTNWNNWPATTYCRSQALCSGNCETFAKVTYNPVYNLNQQIIAYQSSFANAGVNMCDNGWLPPTCSAPCTDVNPYTGECPNNDVIDGQREIIPAASWCVLLKHYQMTISGIRPDGTYNMQLQPRSYIEQISMPIPSGQITLSLDTSSVCPSLQFSGVGDNAVVQLTNSASKEVIVQLTWVGGTGYSPITPIVLPIGPYVSIVQPVPTIGNVSLVVSAAQISAGSVNGTASQWVVCSQLSVDNVASALAIASNTTSTNIIGIATTVANTALLQSYGVAAGLSVLNSALFASSQTNADLLQQLQEQAEAAYLAAIKLNQNMSQLEGKVTFPSPTILVNTCRQQAGCSSTLNTVISTITPTITANSGGGGGGSSSTSSSSLSDYAKHSDLLMLQTALILVSVFGALGIGSTIFLLAPGCESTRAGVSQCLNGAYQGFCDRCQNKSDDDEFDDITQARATANKQNKYRDANEVEAQPMSPGLQSPNVTTTTTNATSAFYNEKTGTVDL